MLLPVRLLLMGLLLGALLVAGALALKLHTPEPEYHIVFGPRMIMLSDGGIEEVPAMLERMQRDH